MRAGANLPAVGGYNQSVILDAIRRAEGGISRVEVAQRTGLSAQTASNVCRRLLDEGLIREAGTHAAGVGKPRTMLELDPNGRFAVGVHLDPSVITVVLLNLAGAVLAHRTIPTDASDHARRTIQRIAIAVEAVIAGAGIPVDRVMGAGVAAPGPVDVASGTVLNPPLLSHWQHVPVRDALAGRLGLPVLLEKDVTAAAVAELWVRTDTERGNMVFFYYGTGVGAGLVVQGEVIRGASSNAGDIGSMIVGAPGGGDGGGGGGGGGPEHRRWLLGDAVMPRYLVQDAIEQGVLARPPAGLSTAAVRTLFGRLARAAAAGEPVPGRLFAAVAEDVSVGLVTLINALDVNQVVFGGPFWTPVSQFLLPRVAELVRRSPVLVPPHPIAFVQSAVGDDVVAVGAACLVLDHTLSPRTSGLLIPRPR